MTLKKNRHRPNLFLSNGYIAFTFVLKMLRAPTNKRQTSPVPTFSSRKIATPLSLESIKYVNAPQSNGSSSQDHFKLRCENLLCKAAGAHM